MAKLIYNGIELGEVRFLSRSVPQLEYAGDSLVRVVTITAIVLETCDKPPEEPPLVVEVK